MGGETVENKTENIHQYHGPPKTSRKRMRTQLLASTNRQREGPVNLVVTTTVIGKGTSELINQELCQGKSNCNIKTLHASIAFTFFNHMAYPFRCAIYLQHGKLSNSYRPLCVNKMPRAAKYEMTSSVLAAKKSHCYLKSFFFFSPTFLVT